MTAPSTPLDPVTLEIMANGLRSVADETFAALMKSAYSTNIKGIIANSHISPVNLAAFDGR